MNFTAIIPQDLRASASPTFAAVNAGTLTITSGSITDSSGAISFGNETLTTTDTVNANRVSITEPTNNHTLKADGVGVFAIESADAFGMRCVAGGGGASPITSFIHMNAYPDLSNAIRQRLAFVINVASSQVIIAADHTGAGTSAFPLNIYTESNTNQVFLDPDGDVGVNTATPLFQLDVAGTFRAQGQGTFTNGIVVSGGVATLGVNTTIGSGAAGTDYTLTFNGEDNDGIITWMEDEDYFLFSDDLLLSTTEKVYFRDTAIGIYSQADTYLDLFADGAVRIGDSSAGAPTNYARFAPDGELNLYGTARVKKNLIIPIEEAFGASAPTARTTESPFLSWTFEVTTTDDCEFTMPVPHDMDYTAAVNVYVEWYTSADQTDDEVNWQISWNAKATGEAVNAGATTDTSGDQACPTQWQRETTLVETIPANSIAADDLLGIGLERIAIVDGTNPTAGTIHVLALHIEYTANKFGEAT